jgi:hypothetical protein
MKQTSRSNLLEHDRGRSTVVAGGSQSPTASSTLCFETYLEWICQHLGRWDRFILLRGASGCTWHNLRVSSAALATWTAQSHCERPYLCLCLCNCVQHVACVPGSEHCTGAAAAAVVDCRGSAWQWCNAAAVWSSIGAQVRTQEGSEAPACGKP